MKSVRPIVFCAAFTFFCGSTAAVVHQRALRPVLNCETPIIDLGEVTQGNAIPFRTKIRNSGFFPLVIRSVSPTCGACIRVRGIPETTISRGQTAEILLELLTMRLKRGNVFKNVIVQSNDPVRPRFVIQVRAKVKD